MSQITVVEGRLKTVAAKMLTDNEVTELSANKELQELVSEQIVAVIKKGGPGAKKLLELETGMVARLKGDPLGYILKDCIGKKIDHVQAM